MRQWIARYLVRADSPVISLLAALAAAAGAVLLGPSGVVSLLGPEAEAAGLIVDSGAR